MEPHRRVVPPGGRPPAPERPAFLTQACGGDHELRREVEAAAGRRYAGRHAGPGRHRPGCRTASRDAHEGSDLAGTRIGRYTITGLIGKGGMGVVYRAVREDDFRLQVAIKLLKRGTDTESALGRFRAERQILAGLQHPNIAHVIDGGATGSGAALLRDGVRRRHAAAGVRRAASRAPAAGTVPLGVRGGAIRARETGRAPGHQAREYPGDPGRDSQAAGFRHRQAARSGG